jgi:hypothetical protein
MEFADFRTNLQAHSPKSQGRQTTYKVRVGGTTLPYPLTFVRGFLSCRRSTGLSY